MSKFLIYGLYDPITGKCRYVGRSSSKLTRPGQHRRHAKQGEKGHKANWIRSLLFRGLNYETRVLEYLPSPENLNVREMWWIAELNKEGNLTNMSPGSTLEDYRAAGIASWRGLSPEQRSERGRRSAAKVPKELRSRISREANAKMTPEQKKNRSAKALAGMTQEVRDRNAPKRVHTLMTKHTAEERSAWAKKASDSIPLAEKGKGARDYWTNFSAEEKSRIFKERWAAIPRAKRSEQALRAWATRRAAKKELENGIF